MSSMGLQSEPPACSPQPSEDPAGRLGCPPNHLLLRSAEKTPPHRRFKGSPVPGHSPLGTCSPPSTGFTAQGKAVGRTDWAPAPSVHSQGWAWLASWASPLSPPGLGWNYTRALSRGAAQGREEEGCDPCPFPWQLPGSQHVSQAPGSPGPGAPLGQAEIRCLPLGKACV